jgi:hypothetical protein
MQILPTGIGLYLVFAWHWLRLCYSVLLHYGLVFTITKTTNTPTTDKPSIFYTPLFCWNNQRISRKFAHNYAVTYIYRISTNKLPFPGLNFVIPYVDSIIDRLTTKDIVLDIPSQEVITKDNAMIIANAIAYINIIPGVKVEWYFPRRCTICL